MPDSFWDRDKTRDSVRKRGINSPDALLNVAEPKLTDSNRHIDASRSPLEIHAKPPEMEREGLFLQTLNAGCGCLFFILAIGAIGVWLKNLF